MNDDLPAWLYDDQWLAKLIGKACYRVSLAGWTVGDAHDRVRRQRLDEIARTESFVYAKVSTESREVSRWLQEQGFFLIDTAITLEKSISVDRSSDDCNDVSFCVRLAQPGDADEVAALAARAFSSDRFHADPLIPNETADRIKAQWARNFFRGERGDAMIIAETDGAISGFNQILLPRDGSLVIDLIAVAPEHRGRGIAAAMTRSAETAFDNIERILVETQIANKPSLTLYQSVGFRLSNSKYVFHRHGEA